MNYKIEFIETLSEDIEEKMRKDLVEYESSHGIYHSPLKMRNLQ